MTDRDFAYWLQGFAELHEAPPSAEQWQIIKSHLRNVFKPAGAWGGSRLGDASNFANQCDGRSMFNASATAQNASQC